MGSFSNYDPVDQNLAFTKAIVSSPFCPQLLEQKLLRAHSLALVLGWPLIHDKRLVQIYSGSHSS